MAFQISPIHTNFERLTGKVTDFIRGNPLVSTAAVGLGTTGLAAGVAVIRKKRRKTKRKKTRKRTSKKRKTKRRTTRRTKKKKWYGKTRSKKIHKTKKGQPYIIMTNGRARFIKKSRAKSMRKRKGGYY